MSQISRSEIECFFFFFGFFCYVFFFFLFFFFVTPSRWSIDTDGGQEARPQGTGYRWIPKGCYSARNVVPRPRQNARRARTLSFQPAIRCGALQRRSGNHERNVLGPTAYAGTVESCPREELAPGSFHTSVVARRRCGPAPSSCRCKSVELPLVASGSAAWSKNKKKKTPSPAWRAASKIDVCWRVPRRDNSSPSIAADEQLLRQRVLVDCGGRLAVRQRATPGGPQNGRSGCTGFMAAVCSERRPSLARPRRSNPASRRAGTSAAVSSCLACRRERSGPSVARTSA